MPQSKSRMRWFKSRTPQFKSRTPQFKPRMPWFKSPLTWSKPRVTLRPPWQQQTIARMEFLNFLLILWAAWLLWRRPKRERLAFRLLIVSCILMALLFVVGTRTSLVPGVNI